MLQRRHNINYYIKKHFLGKFEIFQEIISRVAKCRLNVAWKSTNQEKITEKY